MMAMKKTVLALLAVVGLNQSYGQKPTENKATEKPGLEVATFANGCFWCTEAVFSEVKGVTSVVSGFTGGQVKDPSYEEVCTGTTGHAEALQITFDPKLITFTELLQIFWNTHDPTTLNAQGNDHGTQYRSGIFYHNEKQKVLSEQYKKQLDGSHVFKNPIVTEITPFTVFYPAENYHQRYFELNPNAGYCQFVIRPKVEKFRKQFSAKLKK